MCVVSMRTPGPIVDDSVTPLNDLLLAPAGLAFTFSSATACALATLHAHTPPTLPPAPALNPHLLAPHPT